MPREPERILITGYRGFVGSHLVVACAERYPNALLFGLVHQASEPAHLALQVGAKWEASESSTTPPVVEFESDITDGVRMRAALRETRPDLIFHLAALSSVSQSWEDPAQVLQVNAGGFVRLAEAIRAENLAPRIIVVGSGEQYGFVPPDGNPLTEETLPQPVSPYAVAKVAQDLYAFQYYRAYGLDTVRARPFNHFGPGQRPDFVVANFARQIAQIEAGQVEPTLRVGNLKMERDFLAVSDVIQAYLALAAHGRSGEAYNVGSGVVRSIESVLQSLLELAQVSIGVRVDPARFRPVDALTARVDTTKIHTDTGWRPTADLREALRATLNYWRKVIQVSPSG